MKVFKNLMEGTLVELLEGKLFPFASRTLDHQRILGHLVTTLNPFIKKHKRGDTLVMARQINSWMKKRTCCFPTSW